MDIVSAENVGLSSPRLRRIDEHLLARYVEPGKIAGALTLVARRGKIAFLSPVGKMDRERATPMRTDTLFRIYSMTKPVTSVALMMLHEKGAFQLSDPVHTWLPGWDRLRVYRYGQYPNFVTTQTERPMTVRDLLTHTSGLSYGITERTHLDGAYRRLGISEGKGTLSDMVEKLGQLPLLFSPGTRWSYSVATDVIARLVEILSGRRFDEYLRQEIFEPLGMVDTGYTVAAEKLPRYAANYARSPDGATILYDDPADSAYARTKTLFTGSSGLISTASDYVRFAEMLRRGGEIDGVRIVGSRTIRYMTQTTSREGSTSRASRRSPRSARRATTAWGSGSASTWCSIPCARRSLVRSASTGGAAWPAPRFGSNPAEELTVVFMTQLVPSSALSVRSELKSIVYGAIVD